MSQQQQDNLNAYLPVLERWFGQIMADLYQNAPLRGDGALLMGCPVWGAKYLDRFQNYCLPSIVSDKNRMALAHRCHMVLFTDINSFTRLWALTKELEPAGITIQLLLIPDDVMAEAHRGDPPNKYWILGVAGNAMLQMAGRAGMAFHMLQPDHIYAHEYFPNLFRLAKDHDAIAQPGISAEISTAAKEIEPYRNEMGNLAIPDRDLGAIGGRHLHAQTRAFLMNDAVIPTSLPHSHVLLWRGRDKLVMHSCHMNPAYLAPRLCAKAPTRIPATLDAELPRFIPDDKFYVPKIGDGLTYLEVSDKDKGGEGERVGFEEFSERWWSHVRFLFDWMPYSKTPYEVPIEPQNEFMEDAEIERQFAQLIALLIADNPPGAARRFVSKLAYNR